MDTELGAVLVTTGSTALPRLGVLLRLGVLPRLRVLPFTVFAAAAAGHLL